MEEEVAVAATAEVEPTDVDDNDYDYYVEKAEATVNVACVDLAQRLYTVVAQLTSQFDLVYNRLPAGLRLALSQVAVAFADRLLNVSGSALGNDVFMAALMRRFCRLHKQHQSDAVADVGWMPRCDSVDDLLVWIGEREWDVGLAAEVPSDAGDAVFHFRPLSHVDTEYEIHNRSPIEEIFAQRKRDALQEYRVDLAVAKWIEQLTSGDMAHCYLPPASVLLMSTYLYTWMSFICPNAIRNGGAWLKQWRPWHGAGLYADALALNRDPFADVDIVREFGPTYIEQMCVGARARMQQSVGTRLEEFRKAWEHMSASGSNTDVALAAAAAAVAQPAESTTLADLEAAAAATATADAEDDVLQASSGSGSDE
jgi:hypothetical protein